MASPLATFNQGGWEATGWNALPIEMDKALGCVATHTVIGGTSPDKAYCPSLNIEKTRLWKAFNFSTSAMVYYVVFGKA